MSNTIYHIHHIVPRHMGGTNDKSNLVRLTVAQHAEEHRKLYEQHGCLEDKLAWKMLEGQSMMGENLRIKSKLGWDKANENGAVCLGTKWYHNPENPAERKMLGDNDIIPEGWILGRGKNTWSKNRDYKNASDSHRAKTSESSKKKTMVNGILYNSRSEAAESNNISIYYLRKWVKEGKAHYV